MIFYFFIFLFLKKIVSYFLFFIYSIIIITITLILILYLEFKIISSTYVSSYIEIELQNIQNQTGKFIIIIEFIF